MGCSVNFILLKKCVLELSDLLPSLSACYTHCLPGVSLCCPGDSLCSQFPVSHIYLFLSYTLIFTEHIYQPIPKTGCVRRKWFREFVCLKSFGSPLGTPMEYMETWGPKELPGVSLCFLVYLSAETHL